MLPTPCFTVGMVSGFLQIWLLAFRPKSSILVSSDQRILFFMVWESLGAFWQSPSGLSCSFYWGVAFTWPLYHKGLIGGVLQSWLSFWKVLHRGTLELYKSDHWVHGHLPKPSLLSLAGWLALGRVLVVPNFFNLRMMEATVFLGTFNAAEMFWSPSPDLCNPVSALWG